MVYNRQYNTRNSTGRYNTTGQFVAAEAQHQQHQQQRPQQQQQQFQPPLPPMPPQPAALQQYQRNIQPVNIQPPAQQQQNQQQQQQQQIPNNKQEPDVDMKQETDAEVAGSEDSDPTRPSWMKIKSPGMKKITKKEKRRRQNQHLRRLLTPKNALMVLNEMMLQDQLSNQFTVEPADGSNQYYKSQKTSFCADLTLDGVSYKGYGENKLMARNAAAEQAIRDLIIKRMQKAVTQQDFTATVDAALSGEGGAGGEGGGAGEEEDPLPMIQLASFALHKLFSEWEYEGHKVPSLRPVCTSTSEAEGEATVGATQGPGRTKAAKKPKELPSNARAMHPCMLLTYMRPHLEYRELAVHGDRPQTICFTMGVDVDGATYIGKASNKKEARKAAARAACSALFGVQFLDNAADAAPTPTSAPTPAQTSG